MTGDFIGVDGVLGAIIHDPDRAVTYRVTLGRGPSGVWLTSLPIEPHGDAAIDTAMLRRVPVKRLAEAAALHYATEAIAWAHDEIRPSTGRAYRERPETMPPRRKGGRTPTSKTPVDRRPDQPDKKAQTP